MDAKFLKHRKQSKRSKNVISDKNTNVLVVPPDILKKLGINIGSASGQQIANNINTVQSSEVANNSSQDSILIPTYEGTYANKGNESSIQETANLMKKSVFLSPTFIDTVANVIPGEVEFSNNKSFINNEIDRRSPVHNRYVTNDINKLNSIHDAIQCDVIRNGESIVPILNGDIKPDPSNIEKLNIVKDRHVNELSSLRKQDHIDLQENNQIVDKAGLPKKEDNTITTEEIEFLNNLVSIQEHTQAVDQTHDKDLFLEEEPTQHFIPIEVLGETRTVSDDGKAIVVEYSEQGHNIVALEDNIKLITNSEIECNLISLCSHTQTLPVEIEPEEVANNIISPKESINFIDETNNLSNLISTERCSAEIQLAELKSNPIYEKDNGNVIVDTNIDNLIYLEGNALQIDQAKEQSNLVSSKELLNEITLPQIENDLIFLEEHVQSKEAENSYSITTKGNVKSDERDQSEIERINCFKENVGSQNKSALEEIKAEMNKPNDVCPIDDLQAKHTGRQNIIVTVVDNVIEDKEVENSNIPALNIPLMKEYEKPLLKEKNVMILNKIIDSNNVMNSKLNFFSNGELNGADILHTFGNTKSLKKQKSNGLQYSHQQQCGNSKSLISEEHSSEEMKSNLATALKRKEQKIHIISEEIITSSNSEKYRRLQFPVTNTKINHGNITFTNNLSSVSSYNSHLFSSDTLVADTHNSVEMIPPISEEVDSTIHDNKFSVPVRINESLGNALLANNSRNHIINKHTNSLSGSSEDKVIGIDQKPDKISKNQNNNTNNFIEKKIVSKNVYTQEKDITKKINSSEDELDNILKSTKENNNAILQADKVREVANYIKKYSHIYRDNKIEKKLDIMNTKNDKRERINAKTTTSKSKLCIQGVEKPGGNNDQKKASGEMKILKTYTRQRKSQNFQKSVINPDNIETIICNIDDISITDELNSVDLAISLKTQVFCLCYDFGHLQGCDNSYEHIHFWHHNTSTDLETIFSIYNDTIFTDRTLLDSDILSEISIDDTIIGDICWNYFSCELNETCCKTLVKTNVMKDFSKVETKQCVTDYQQKECKNVLSKTTNSDTKILDKICAQDIDNSGTKDLDIEEIQKASSTISTIIAEKSNIETDANIHSDMSTINKKYQPITSVLSTDVDAEASTSLKGNMINESNKSDQIIHKFKDPQVSANNSELQISKNTETSKVAVGCEEKKNESINESDNLSDGSSKKESKDNCATHKKEDGYEPSSKRIVISKEEKLNKTNKIRDSPSKEISEVNADTYVTKTVEFEPSSKRPQKRSYSGRGSLEPTSTESCEEPSSKKNIKCGVCGKLLSESTWEDHVVKKHCHIAWRAGTTFNIDDPDLLKKLEHTLQDAGKLKCPSCYTQTKKMDKFMDHIKKCVVLQDAIGRVANKEKSKDSSPGEKLNVLSDVTTVESELSSKRSLNRSYTGRASLETGDAVKSLEPPAKKNIKCGICDNLLPEAKWEHHVAKKHCHIAWRAGSTFNVDNPDLIKKLVHTLQVTGRLKCPSCQTQTKKLDKFIKHIKKCLRLQDTSSRRTSYKKDTVRCGVCKQNVLYTSWAEHIGREHNYLAWIDGQNDLDLEDEAAVIKHLRTIISNNGSLICYKCGLNRQRAQLYLDHIKTCNRTEAHCNSTITSSDLDLTNDQEEPSTSDSKILTCGVCKQEVEVAKWVEHIAKEHNYLAWTEGSTPLNVDDEEAVWNYLQEFIRQSANGLVCYKCGLSRRRVKLYLSHIKTCDGKEVDLEFEDVSKLEDIFDKKVIECGVCNAMVSIVDWYKHIGKEHNYLAWRADATPLDLNDEEAVKEHLQDIIRRCEFLTCYKCGLNRKRAKLYLTHVRNCDGSQSRVNESTDSVSMKAEVLDVMDVTEQSSDIVTCAVCNEKVLSNKWIDHIEKVHQYLAWQQGDTPLDVTDDDAVKLHLSNICKDKNGLTCNRCQITKKYPRTFQHHIMDCNGMLTHSDRTIKIYDKSGMDHFDVSDVTTETVTCGVCNKIVITSEWISHIQAKHDYIAWFVGKPPIDLNNPLIVLKHLVDVSRKVSGLKCSRCGVVRRYAKKFLDHITSCDSEITDREVVCGVCAETVHSKNWRDHAMDKHYNVAWMAEEPPININLPYVVEPYIKAYLQRYKKLICKTCRASRASAVGFYAHIITCGKTEEETEVYKGVCNICNNKYLLIYKNQHMAMHKEQEHALERKLLMAKEKEMEENQIKPVEIVGGRRRAAVKAITVIEKYNRKTTDGTRCKACGFQSEIESEMSNHVCVDNKNADSDSDASIDLDRDSSDDDDDSDVNSNISEEEREAQEQKLVKPKNHGDSRPKIQRLPYGIRNINTYMRRSAQHFAELHLTDEDLFTEWRKLEYEILSDDELTNYMPPLEESCKVSYGDGNDWLVYKRFEASRNKDTITLFTGACIQSICWVPSHVRGNLGASHQYLSVITHLATDAPRHVWHDTPQPKPILIQIWDCGNLISCVPEFVMGIALDCSTIWSIDWCPSGSRDILDIDIDKPNQVQRLGLVAAACANGYAYIFAVPYPSTIQESEHKFCKLKPVAELRLVMRTNRKIYPATAIKWSTQKGHAHIIVGYGDGTTAYFDLKNESPLLRSTENDVTIIYPYYDERAQGMCIEDVDVFASQELSHGPGPVVAGSVSGVGASTRPAGCTALHSHAAAARVLFPPHWPAPLLAGDDNLVSQAVNELEWYSGGRRVGGMCACCGCAWCGRVALTAAPLVRLVRAHPAYPDLHRQVIALLHMIPFGNKRKRKNDELSMIVEPLTYSDAIVKYGIEFKQITAKDKATQQRLNATPRDTFPERFPLAEVTSMMFCPSSTNHNKLALAVHAGLIFIMNV